MSAGDNGNNRDVIPRWRSVRRTIAAGEFRRLPENRNLPAVLLESLAEARSRWEFLGDQISASELVGAAIVAGATTDASDAARFLVDSGSTPQLRGLGLSIIQGEEVELSLAIIGASQNTAVDQVRHRIREERRRLNSDPRNAIAWSNIARRYTMLGQLAQAEHALRVALELAPDSRYLHRVATWFFVHIGQPDEAYDMLGRFPRTQQDPWLMAAYIAVANSSNLKVLGMKTARRLLESGDFAERETAELASQIATVALKSGEDRRARKLFKQSLDSPTDNSLAQVEWASHRITQLEVNLDQVDVPFKSEALALSATQEGNWQEALRYSSEWLDDQPFETRAAVHASYIAAVAFEDWFSAESYAEIGLRSRPGHPMLTNNYAYALIEAGKLTEASKVLGAINMSEYSNSDRVAITATKGLFEYRSGRASEGEEHYKSAIELAHRDRNYRQEAIARAMMLREVLRLDTDLNGATQYIGPLHDLLPYIRDDKAMVICIRRATQPISEVFGAIEEGSKVPISPPALQ